MDRVDRVHAAQAVGRLKAAFDESGMNAPLDEITRRAGVASGTLYLHFPTRLDLVEVVLAEQIAELVGHGRELLAPTRTPRTC